MNKKADFLNTAHLTRLPKDVKIVIGRIEFVLESCRDKRVLHLGCVDEGMTLERIRNGGLLHIRLLGVARELYGVDINKEGLNLLQEEGITNLIKGNVEQLDCIQELHGQKFDVILATEVIEHLDNPGLFLQSSKKLFEEKTIMILTTPNAHRITGFRWRLKGFEYVHPDHNYWFSWSTLASLLKKNGYQVMGTYVYSFVNYRIPLARSVMENIIENRSIMSGINEILSMVVRKILYRINPFFADGLIFIVKPYRIPK